MIAAIVGTIAIVAVTIAVGVFADRKLGLFPRPEQLAEPKPRSPGHAAGEAPATAIRAGVVQLAKLRTSQRCRACRTLLVAAGDDDHVLYNEHDLVVVQFRCPACAVKRSLYVDQTA